MCIVSGTKGGMLYIISPLWPSNGQFHSEVCSEFLKNETKSDRGGHRAPDNANPKVEWSILNTGSHVIGLSFHIISILLLLLTSTEDSLQSIHMACHLDSACHVQQSISIL